SRFGRLYMNPASPRPVIFGYLGVVTEETRARVHRMLEQYPHAERVCDETHGYVYANGANQLNSLSDRKKWGWSTGALPQQDNNVEGFDYVGIDIHDGAAQLQGSQSGALPIYVEQDSKGIAFSSRLD